MEAEKVHEVIGELLAQGHTDGDIIATLEEENKLSFDEASEALRGVYDGWQHTRDALDLTDNNLIDWHVHLRKYLLQQAIGQGTIPSLRLALSILDSLATIQGISTPQGQTVPLTITLVEKEEGPDDVDTKSPDAVEHPQGESG